MKIQNPGKQEKLPTFKQFVAESKGKKNLSKTLFRVELYWKSDTFGYATLQTHAFRYLIYENSPQFDEVIEFINSAIESNKPIVSRVDLTNEEIEIDLGSHKGEWKSIGTKGFRFNEI